MALLLNPRAWLALALAGFLAFTHFSAYRAGRAAVRADFDAYRLAMQQQADLQREANRGTARQAEEKQATQAATRERYITKTTREIDHASTPLAAVPVPADARRLLNAAAACAREDRPAPCGAGDAVPAAR